MGTRYAEIRKCIDNHTCLPPETMQNFKKKTIQLFENQLALIAGFIKVEMKINF